MVENHETSDDREGMAGTEPATDSLGELQSAEQRALMDLVDRLRRSGLSSMLQLPQIVVCGDQSSGKSSVLEAITEIPFPRKENLCTRFATEIIMRRGDSRSITCKINPDKNRPENEQAKLLSFGKTIEDFSDLPTVIDEATEAMGLGSGKAFSRDVLSVEIWGLKHPQMTLVDLPGLIHSSSKVQSEEDVEIIKTLVNDYISEKRTIILAVISAKNDYANQIILKRCRDFDPEGTRTLGIITKPDFLRAGSENEALWLDLAQNKDIYFELGWHMLKNRSDEEHSLSFQERNSKEGQFFNTGNYKKLRKDMKGIDSLRQRLSLLLFNHLKKELPDFRAELDAMAQETTEEIEKLGQARSTLLEQRVYLTELFTSVRDILRQASNGDYDHKFFGALNVNKSVMEGNNARRLRAVVQSLNMGFADRIRCDGRSYVVSNNEMENMEETSDEDVTRSDKDDHEQSSDDGFPQNPTTLSKMMSHRQEVQHVIDVMTRSRGRELQGTFNPLLIRDLFQELSTKWEAFARAHIAAVVKASELFVFEVLQSVSIKEVKERLRIHVVQPNLKSNQVSALQEFTQIMSDKARHAITYNHYFSDTLQKLQQQRRAKLMIRSSEAAKIFVNERQATGNYQPKQYLSPEKFEQKLGQVVTADMSKFSAEQMIDAVNAYYKDEMKYFVGVVTKQVIERHIVAPISEVLSLTALARFSEKQIADIVAEPSESLRLREHLTTKLDILKEGQELFMNAMGSF